MNDKDSIELQDTPDKNLKRRGKTMVKAAIIEIVVLFISIPLFANYISEVEIFSYLIVWGIINLLWSVLPDGELTKKGQIMAFAVIPYMTYLFVLIIGLSCFWMIGFVILYGAIVSLKYHIDLNDGHSGPGSHTISKYGGRIIGSTLNDLTKTSRGRRK